jgi:class 3 adenylate cyclase/pimeloyl-ACP methyl ester carboxylesterase
MEPQHRFSKSADGTEIVYTKVGDGPPLLAVFPCICDFETVFSTPEGADFVQGLAETHTYLQYDRRGTGLSQRVVGDLSLDMQVADLEAVVSSEGIEQFDAFGGLDGCAVLLQYAVRNPGRVRRMILWSPYAQCDFRSRERLNAMIELIRADGWSIVRKAIVDAILPSGPPERVRDTVAAFKRCVEPDVYCRILEYETTFDITGILAALEAQVLILHTKDSRIVPIATVRAFASHLPQSEVLLLNGDAASPWMNNAKFMGQVKMFLGVSPPSRTLEKEHRNALATVLFTDLVGHTEMMSRLGDERGRAVLREHETITRDVLKQHGGTEVKTMGDGFMASFGSVTKAVECAIALQRAFDQRNNPGVGARHSEPRPSSERRADDPDEAANREDISGASPLRSSDPGQTSPEPFTIHSSPFTIPEPLHVRVGLNAGEPIEEDGDLFGATVILASRIAAKADAGEILVADTVRGLCSGKGFLFADRGEFVAKGFEEPVRVCEVRWRE